MARNAAGRRVHTAQAPKRQEQQPQQQQCPRSLCPVINQQLIGAADRGGVPALLAVVEQRLEDMNLVNVTTALHRLAKLSTQTSGPLLLGADHCQLLSRVVRRTRELLDRSMTVQDTSPSRCQTAANIAWSAATLGYGDLDLVASVLRFSERLLPVFTAFELASLLSALAGLAATSCRVLSFVCKFFEMAAPFLAPKVHSLKGTMLIAIVDAYSQVGWFEQQLFKAVAPQLAQKLRNGRWCSSQRLAITARCYVQAGLFDVQLFQMLAQCSANNLRAFQIQELQYLYTGLLRAGIYHREIYDRFSQLALAKTSPLCLIVQPVVTNQCVTENALAPPPTAPAMGSQGPGRRPTCLRLQDAIIDETFAAGPGAEQAHFCKDEASSCGSPLQRRTSDTTVGSTSTSSTPSQSSSVVVRGPRMSWADLMEDDLSDTATYLGDW